MALAPFLAAGYTHKDKSAYQQVVYKGLDFLTQNVNKKYTNLQTGNVSWFEDQGTMYSHGLAAMAMCEAYGMTKDKALLPYAQGGSTLLQPRKILRRRLALCSTTTRRYFGRRLASHGHEIRSDELSDSQSQHNQGCHQLLEYCFR